jgi:hypothetical protein
MTVAGGGGGLGGWTTANLSVAESSMSNVTTARKKRTKLFKPSQPLQIPYINMM